MKKSKIFILLLFLLLLAEENVVFAQRHSLAYDHYTKSTISNRNYNYEIQNRKKMLESEAADIHRAGVLSAIGIYFGASYIIISALSKSSPWLFVPLSLVIGSSAGGGSWFLFNHWGEKVYKQAKSIEIDPSDNELVLGLNNKPISKDAISSSYLNYALGTYEYTYTAQSAEYAECMMWCGMMCMEAGDNMQAKKVINESCDLFRKYGNGPFEGKDTINEIFYLDLKSKLAYNADIPYDAIRYAETSCQLKRDFFGGHSEIYLKALLDLSKLHTERLNYRKAQKYHNLGYTAYVELIQKEFCEKSESERTTYWASVKDYISKTFEIASLSAKGAQHRSNDSINAAAYNAMLLSKGLLLNTTISFENFITESGNKQAQATLEYKKQAFSQGAPQTVLDSLDYAILDALKASGQKFVLPQLSINWKDVKKNLSPDDLAIEFFRNANGSFGALLLKQNWRAPRIVLLKEFISVAGNTEHLASALHDNLFESFSRTETERLWAIGKAIWCDDIIKHFPVTEQGRVFFSADDELLVSGIEYLPLVRPEYQGERVSSYHSISDIYNVYRVTSTRELVNKKGQTGTTAAVYGGLSYDMYSNNLTQTGLHRDARSAEQPILFLKGTKTEADSIVSIINRSESKGFKAISFTGAEGTEASFKALSGMRPSIIHVGTHGFYYSYADSLTIRRFGLGDNPLSHTGLFLAGADSKWFGDPIPKGEEDGFLTALEISSIDLRGLDLVVLSACETGKGEISSDGVFGLQRGFKMAGANSILMSLWEVDDDATCLLMTEFYKNWMSGRSKHDAFKMARQAVRSHTEKGWDDPKYWASFILLDALY